MSQLRFGDNFWALDEAPEIVFEIFDDDDVAQKRRAVTDVRVACAESVIASHSEHRRFDEIFTNLLPLDRRLIGTRFAYPIGDRKAIEVNFEFSSVIIFSRLFIMRTKQMQNTA